MPTLNQLQELTVATGEVMHATNPAFMEGSNELRTSAVQRGREALTHETEMRERLLNGGWFASNEAERESLNRTGQAFDAAVGPILDLLGGGKLDEAGRDRERMLRPEYDHYVATTRQLTQHAHSESLRTSDMLTLKTGSLSRLLLGLGSWPVIVLGLFLSIFAIFVVAVLLNVFLRREHTL